MRTPLARSVARSGIALFLAALVLSGVACAKSPEARRDEADAAGQRYLKDGKLGEAIVTFQTALQADKDHLPTLHALGQTFARKYWFLDATRELGRARRLAPQSLPIAADFARALV